MLIPLKWLKEYVDIDITPSELAEKLVSCGFEIEGMKDLSAGIKNVAVGRIISLEKHLNADKLQVCKIDTGKYGVLQIVTGAHNIAVGDLVPVAMDGAVLPTGKVIKTGDLRGVTSYGMLCSGGELNLTESDYEGASVNGIMILKEGTPGEDINILLGNDEIVLDVGITANRTDANSVYGIAREVAAATGKALRPLKLTYKENRQHISSYLSLENNAQDLCPRYIAKVVKEIKLEKSPKLIRDRLRAVGVRPINNIVDITNYVLFEVGQPMHAFDINAVKGAKIVVRRAAEGEKITALDGKKYTLTNKNLVIANEKEAMAVAGVMGGEYCSVLPDTSAIVFESARFARDNVRRTTKSINLRSDSSARFEKGVDFYSQRIGMDRALTLIDQYGYGQIVGGEIDSFPVKPEKKVISFTAASIERILGIAVPEKDILRILNGLTLETSVNNGVFSTVIPGYREDMVGINDIAEEIIRMYGYNNITPTLIKYGKMVAGGKSEKQKMVDKLKASLTAQGAYEIITYSFTTPKAFDMLGLPSDSPLRNAIRLDNPLGEDFSVMRTSLTHGMLKVLATNTMRGNKSGRFFEIAKTYLPKALPLTEYPVEENQLIIGSIDDDFYSFKAIIEELFDIFRIEVAYTRGNAPYLHPTRTAEIKDKNGVTIGLFGEVSDQTAERYGIDRRVYIAEMDAEYIVANAKLFNGFIVVSKYPAVERDLAVVAINSLEAEEILSAAKKACGAELISATIFDIYTGGQIPSGYKSVALKLLFQSTERTLTDTEIGDKMQQSIDALAAIGARLR